MRFASVSKAAFIGAGCAFICLFTERLAAQDQESVPESNSDASVSTASESGIGGLDTLHRIPPNSFGGQKSGVPYSGIFRDTGAPYTNAFTDPRASATANYGQATDRTVLATGRFRETLPYIRRGFDPEQAHFKMGPVYLRFNSLSGAVLYSDNVNLTHDNRKSDAIAIMRLNMTVVCQFSEGLQFALSGALVYLPLQNQAGISNYGNKGNILLGLAAVPALLSQFAYTADMGGWPVTLADDFHVGLGQYSNGVRDDFPLFDGVGFKGEDRAGRYVFRAPASNTNSNNRNATPFRNSEFTYTSNVISIATERLFPTDVRLKIKVYHEDLWYNQNRRGLPPQRDDGAIVSLHSERENERFKPYAVYQTDRYGSQTSFDHIFRLGLAGPITDQLNLQLEAGYFLHGSSGRSSALWSLKLGHEAGPYTREYLEFGRSISAFHEEISTFGEYELQQILGPTLSANTFAQYAEVSSSSSFSNSRDELRTGLRLTYVPGIKTNMRLSGIYAHITHDLNSSDSDTFTGRFELSYQFSDSFTVRLLCQYQRREASLISRDSYYEDLALLTLTKDFP